MKEEMTAAALRKKEAMTERLRRLAINMPWPLIMWAVCAYFIGRAELLSSLYPFAPAFMGAAAAFYGRRSLFFLPSLLLGLLAVAEGSSLVAYVGGIVLLTLIFIFYPIDSKKQFYMVPIMVAAVTAVGKGLAVSLSGGTSYELMISGFESILAAALAPVMLVLLRACGGISEHRRLSGDEIACCFVLLIGLLGGLADLYSGTLSYQKLFSCLIILTVGYLGGGGAGSAIGALIGIVPSLSQVVPPTLIASYAFAGLLAGVFNNFGRVGSAMGFLFGNLMMAFYIADANQIAATLLSATVAALLFFLLPKVVYSRLAMAFDIMPVKSAAEERSERVISLSGRRLKNVGLLFRDLAKALRSPIAGESEEEDSFKPIMSSLDRQLCLGCSLHDICWKADQLNTYRGVLAMFKVVEKKGKAEVKDVPNSFSRRCPHLKELVILINCLYELYCRSNFWTAQRKSSRRLTETQMQGVAAILEEVAQEVAYYDRETELLQHELCLGMQASGLPVENAGIDNLNDRYIEAWVNYTVCPGEKRCRRAMEAEIERVLGRGFTISELVCGCQSKGVRCVYRILSASAAAVEIGKAQCAKDRLGICGDSSEAVLLDNGKKILMLSDGMGVGQKARSQSAYALELISRFLEAGFEQHTAIDAVNSAMTLMGSEESFVTLDICLLDLYSREAEFMKMGGAPSFVKRGKEVRLIKGSGLPVGMLNKVEKDVIRERLLPQDMIIMASDGLLEGDNQYDAEWLRRVLEVTETNDPQEMAEQLLDKVLGVTGGRIKDDITVMVTKLVG